LFAPRDNARVTSAISSDDERRARIGVRHFLAEPAPSVEAVAEGLVGLHSSDPITVFLSLRARLKHFDIADLEGALYERKSLVRMLGMRRTMFVVPIDLAATMDVACTQPISIRERKRLVDLVEGQGLAKNGARWLERVEERTFAALREMGEATATQLTKVVPELGRKLTFGEGKKWAGEVGMSTRVLFLLASEGRIVRGRPLGTWVSSQYRWAPTDGWLEGGLPAVEPAKARVDLVQRWLRAFGPGTANDIKWWTGWTMRQTLATLEAAEGVEVELSTGSGYVLRDDTRRTGVVKPWVGLLPGLDPTAMAWKDRAWYLGDHGAVLFDRNGNAGPTVWVDGRVVGGWAQRADGNIVVELLEPVGKAAELMIEAEVDQLTLWLGDVRIRTRFPGPLEKQLR
jgi:hypothetical protein